MRLLSVLLSIICLSGAAGAACPDLDGIAARAEDGRAQVSGIRILVLQVMVEAPDGTYSIRNMPPLPEGGIGGEDLCGVVTLYVIDEGKLAAGAGAVPLTVALMLDSDTDLAAKYPQAVEEANRRGQLHSWRETAVSAHIFPDGTSPRSDPQRLLSYLTERHMCPLTVLATEKAIFVPDCPGG